MGIYARTGAGAVVHAHPPAATALSCVVDEVPTVHYGMLAFGGSIRVAPYRTFGTAGARRRGGRRARGALRRADGQPRRGLLRARRRRRRGADGPARMGLRRLLAGARGRRAEDSLARPTWTDVARAVAERGYGQTKDGGRVSEMKAVALGAHVLDVLARPVEAIPEGQGGALVEEIRLAPAGAAGGTAVSLAKLGAEVTSAGAIGTDALGRPACVRLLADVRCRRRRVSYAGPTSRRAPRCCRSGPTATARHCTCSAPT